MGPQQRANLEQRARDHAFQQRRREENLDPWGQPLPTGQVCTKCHEDKPFAEFPPNKKVSTGRSSWCRECYRGANRLYRSRLREDATG